MAKKLTINYDKLPKKVLALLKGKKHLGFITHEREAIPGLIVFENAIDLAFYEIGKGQHPDHKIEILTLNEARNIVRNHPRFQSIMMYKPPGTFTVEYVSTEL